MSSPLSSLVALLYSNCIVEHTIPMFSWTRCSECGGEFAGTGEEKRHTNHHTSSDLRKRTLARCVENASMN